MKQIIHNRAELCDKIFGESENVTDEHLSHEVYKNTSCGAWFKSEDNGVCLGTIVEGSDAEFSRSLSYPFSVVEWDATINELETLAEEAWQEANEEDDDMQFDVNGFEICVGDTVIWTDPDGGNKTTHQVTDKHGEIIVLDEGTEVLGHECEVVH
jgi:plastocyanin